MARKRTPHADRTRRAATIKEVAAHACVSTATVSRVLAAFPAVGEDVRRRVLAAVRELDYHPNQLARGLRARKHKVIGLLLPDLQNPFFTEVAHGVEDVLWREGFTLMLGHSNGLAEREQTYFGVLRGEGAAGLILIPGNGADADYSPLTTWRIPVVAVDRAPQGLVVDQVRVENREGARRATEHLISLGYREIALLNGPRDFDVSRARQAGFQYALADAHLPRQPEYIVHGDFRQAGGYAAMNQLLALPKPPRAVLIANNLMTLGALQAIHERDIRIPEDIAVIGFDDMPWAASLCPALTAVAQPAEELGRAAAELLLQRLRDPERPVRQVVLPTHLIIRGSCGAAVGQKLSEETPA